MKSTNCENLQLVLLYRLFYVTELNKDDNSHSSGACFHIFHILICRCDINNGNLYIINSAEHKVLIVGYCEQPVSPSVVRLCTVSHQQFLSTTSSLKLLNHFPPNVTEMFHSWPFTKIAQMFPLGCQNKMVTRAENRKVFKQHTLLGP